MRTKALLTALIASVTLAAGSASAAEISVPDHSFTPDGSTTTSNQITNIYNLNGNSAVLPAGGTSLAYLVLTCTFGANSDAHLGANFLASGQQNRLGVLVQDTGLVSFQGTGSGTSFNIGQDMAGETVVLLAKLDYDVNRDPSASNDTLMNVWVNPTASSVEGSGTSAGDMYTIWNSAGFHYLKQTISNQSTPGTAGTSTITDTIVLTGTDATWEKALQLAVPAPGTLVFGE